MSIYHPPIYLPHLTLSFLSAGCLSFFLKEVVCKVYKDPTAQQVDFTLVTVEHHTAKLRKDGVSEIEEAVIYTRALCLAAFKDGTSLATARELFDGADDDGADGPGADGAGADGAGADGAEDADQDDHGAAADSRSVCGAQSGSNRRLVVAPDSEEEAEYDDAQNRAPKKARTNVYASPAGKAPASSSSGVAAKASSSALPAGRVARGSSAGSSSSPAGSSSRVKLTQRSNQRSGATGSK